MKRLKKLLDQAFSEAKDILREHRRQLDLIANELLEHETLDAAGFQRLLHQDSSRPAAA